MGWDKIQGWPGLMGAPLFLEGNRGRYGDQCGHVSSEGLNTVCTGPSLFGHRNGNPPELAAVKRWSEPRLWEGLIQAVEVIGTQALSSCLSGSVVTPSPF